MRKLTLFPAAIITLSLTLASCGGASSGSESMLFGKVPAIVEAYTAEQDAIKEEFKKCSSTSDAEKLVKKAEALTASTFTKAEEAAKEWSGTTLNIVSDGSFSVRTPVVATFDGFFSKLDMEPRYSLAGEIVAAKDHVVNGISTKVVELNPNSMQHIMLIGLDEAGSEVVRQSIGMARLSVVGNEVAVASGTPVKLESLVMSDKKAAEYPKVKTLRLAVSGQ